MPLHSYARYVACPDCSAPKGKPCVQAWGDPVPIHYTHKKRYAAATAAGFNKDTGVVRRTFYVIKRLDDHHIRVRYRDNGEEAVLEVPKWFSYVRTVSERTYAKIPVEPENKPRGTE